MKTKQLILEAEGATAAFAFGRFNPAHQGHIEVWRTVEQAGANWFIGTNSSTLGPNDPLTFEQKSAWMEEIYPAIAGHIVAEQSVLTLAAYIFKKTRKNERATVAYITDAADWAWSGKLLNQYNGVEGAHGYYKFAQIIHVPSPRVSSATALRDAARADDKVAFYHASGTDPKSKVAGLTYFDTVKQAVEKYPLPVKRAKKVKEQGVTEAKADPTGSWVVYDGSKVKKFKTREGAKAYAGKNGGTVASSEYYHDKIQKQGVDESRVDEDITRRGFLQGAGAAAVAGAAGVSTKADAQEINKWVKYAKELLVNSPLNRVHQDTGYDLRNWVSNNVSNWVNDYCFKTNSYNAKEVLDYSHKQGIEASGLDKQNALVTAFLTNMKSRCQDYLDAYRSSINEKLREYYNLAKSNQQSPSSQSQPSQQNDIKSLPVGTQKIIMDSILFYYFCKSSGWDKLDKDKDLVGNMCHNIKLELGKYIQLTNQKDLINNIYSKTSAELDGWKTNGKDNWIKLRDSSISDPMSIFTGIRKLNSDSKPEFESVNQGVAESLTQNRNLSPITKKYIQDHNWKLTKVNPMSLDTDGFDDPFNRVIDIDTDHPVNFKDPIIVHANGATIIDGFHRVYQAQLQGLKQIPAYVPIEQRVVEDAKTTEHYNGIEISMEKEDDVIMVTAMMSGGRELGHVWFIIDDGYLMPQDLEVEERYQGQGIAATMYDYVKSKGYKIRRSGQQTDAGAGFWDKHKPGKNVWEQGVAEEKQRLDAKCWTGYKKQGTKMKGGVRVNNCVKESALDEKSVSQAQFRTMAAVANNPEFAKKVGISPEVGKEFHGADKNTNYKKLPKKVDEILDPTTMSANVLRYLGRKTATAFPWIATGAVGGALAYSGLLAPIMSSVGGVGTALAGLSTEVMAYGAVGGMAATPSLIQIVKDLFAADENSIQAGIKRWVEKHVGDENDVQEFINLHAQSAYLKQPMFRWRAEEWKTKMKTDEAEAYLEKHNKGWLDAEKQKVIDAEKAKADAAKPGMKPATESLDSNQKRAGQVGSKDRARQIGQVLAKPTKQHPYKGRLVGEADGFNGEYDDEAGMAKSNLLTTARAVAGLLKTIQDNDNLPEWGQEKIAKAEMMLVSIWDYLQSQKEQGIDPKVEGVTEAEIDFGPEWDEIVKRVGQRAKQGPLKTVWDEKKRVYRNVPANDPDQPSKEVDEASLATMRDYFAGNDDAKDPTKLAQMRDFFNKNKPAGGKVQDKRFASRQAYELWLKQNGLRDLSSK